MPDDGELPDRKRRPHVLRAGRASVFCRQVGGQEGNDEGGIEADTGDGGPRKSKRKRRWKVHDTTLKYVLTWGTQTVGSSLD